MLFEYKLKADKHNFYNITVQVRDAVSKSGIANGIVHNNDDIFRYMHTFPDKGVEQTSLF